MNELYEKQDSKCAICRVDLLKPVVDHNHETGEVRGLLCASCNTGLGQFEDDPKIVLEAYFYLRRHLYSESQVADTESVVDEVDPMA